MIVKRGRYLNARVQPHQCANDWISVDVLTGPDAGKQNLILSPAEVEMEPGETDWFVLHAGGAFWSMWRLNDDWTRFEPIGPRPAASPRRPRRTPRHWGR